MNVPKSKKQVKVVGENCAKKEGETGAFIF